MIKTLGTTLSLALLFTLGCHSPASKEATPPTSGGARWAIAIHGGAGTLDRDAPAEQLQEYRAALTRALEVGRERLARGEDALDVCEAVIRVLEDDRHFNAGAGAVFNELGEHELDSSIMDGASMRCGAVAGVRTVKNPVSLARLVMEETPHVLLMGEGAEQFATKMDVERVPNTYFDTELRRRVLEEVLEERARTGSLTPAEPKNTYGTVGCVVLDQSGGLAAATSTGGLTGKRWGRVGDSPIIGAGNYADGFAAVSGTGTGEEYIRYGVARTVSARMQFAGQSLEEAAHAVVFDTLAPDDGGLIGVDRDGNLTAQYNTEGMYRGLADSRGRFEVLIFEE